MFKKVGQFLKETDAKVMLKIEEKNDEMADKIAEALPKGPVAVGILCVKAAYHGVAIAGVASIASASAPAAAGVAATAALYGVGKKVFAHQHRHEITGEPIGIEHYELAARETLVNMVRKSRENTVAQIDARKSNDLRQKVSKAAEATDEAEASPKAEVKAEPVPA